MKDKGSRRGLGNRKGNVGGRREAQEEEGTGQSTEWKWKQGLGAGNPIGRGQDREGIPALAQTVSKRKWQGRAQIIQQVKGQANNVSLHHIHTHSRTHT